MRRRKWGAENIARIMAVKRRMNAVEDDTKVREGCPYELEHLMAGQRR